MYVVVQLQSVYDGDILFSQIPVDRNAKERVEI